MTQNLLINNSFKGKKFAQTNSFTLIESIKKYIYENECPIFKRDISHLNIIDASKVVTICSTYHYAKYPHGEITWIVNSFEVKTLTRPLSMGNIKFITVQ